ncbi:MAG TPA: PhzF family phenazine biosynthesis protein [Vicinamibacterales bacterium]
MTQSYLHWDVFTGERFFGNQLAVFTDARGLDTATMQRMTREMNFSESTFVLPAESPETDVRMRIFTPTQELPMAGHPTIGTTFALAHTGVLAPGRPRVVFGLNVGPTPVDLEWRETQLAFAWMTQGLPQFGPALQERALVASTLGLGVADLMDGVPVQAVSCGFPVLLVPIRDRDAVDRAVSDAAAFRRLTARLGQMLPVLLFAVLPQGGEATVYSRLFAPEFGIIEDPATGGATGPLGCYLVQHGLVGVAAAGSMLSLQGVAMGRRSRLHISIDGAPDAITGVRVGGEAVLVGRGELYL